MNKIATAFLLLGLIHPVAAQQGKKVTEGKVSGVVQTTGNCSPLGALAYIPGRSYFARLDGSGAFTLDGVPVGTGYTLRVEVIGDASVPPYHDTSFDVTSSVVSLATIAVNCAGSGGGGGGGTTCGLDSECSSTQYCDTGANLCVLKKSVGSPCFLNKECASGICDTGVCVAAPPQ
jgi:hypothetical protein